MGLFFHLAIHFIASLLVGYIVWKIWKKPRAAFFSAFVGGIFIDLDHIVDYFLAFGWSFDLTYFIKGYQFLKSDKIYILLHGWEYILIILVLVFILKNKLVKTVLLSFAIASFFHLGTDLFLNEGAQFKTYSIYYRIKSNFNLKGLVTDDHYINHQKMKKDINFK